MGYDPEVMIWDNRLMHMASALRVLGEDHQKNNPIDLGDGIKFYADNALGEFKANPVSADDGPEPFVNTIRSAMTRIQEHLGSGFSLSPRAAYTFPSEELGKSRKNEIGEELNPAWDAGCMPNLNVYSGEIRTREAMAADFHSMGCMRTGSFHIHIGEKRYGTHDNLTLMTTETKVGAVRLLDIYLGCASVLFDQDPTSIRRRKLYGKAGEYRVTMYGVEYRCLGPSPLADDKKLTLVFSLAEYAIRLMEHPDWKDILASVNEHHVQEVMNLGNTAMAMSILKQVPFPSRLLKEVVSI